MNKLAFLDRQPVLLSGVAINLQLHTYPTQTPKDIEI